MDIDDLEGLDEATRKEIEELQKVTRDKDGGEAFVEAQFSIGEKLEQGGEIDVALEIWQSIKKSDSKKGYAIAQFQIGQSLKIQGKPKNAIEVWQSIEKTDDREVYAFAQNKIGNTLHEQGEIEKALGAWYKIERNDNLFIYVIAQQSIGWALKVQGDIIGALEVWGRIERRDNPEAYAAAQLMSGWVFEDQGDITSALKAWSKVKKIDSLTYYSSAQLAIARTLSYQGDVGKALKSWHKIRRTDDPESYIVAQQHIASTLNARGDIEGALEAWKNIKRIDDKERYSKAQFSIARSLIIRNLEGDIESAKSHFMSASEFYIHESYCYIKISEMLESKDNNIIGEILYNFMEEVINIISVLTLNFDDLSTEVKLPERKLAHYTSVDTVDKLLNVNEHTGVASPFRLNTINNVNDPSEGQLLLDYLDIPETRKVYTAEFDEKMHAFISCFTFNHDSLNQFRLYGKKDNLEASGVSLVFNGDFFQEDISFRGMSFLAIKSSDKINKEKDYTISKQPVMRCIYLDPVSRYIQLAQRNRLTFYREAEAFENAV